MRDRGPPEWVTGMAESVYLQRIVFAQRIFGVDGSVAAGKRAGPKHWSVGGQVGPGSRGEMVWVRGDRIFGGGILTRWRPSVNFVEDNSTPSHSSVAQWQSIRLLTEGL